MPDPDFPQIDWSKEPGIDLDCSLEKCPVTLLIPLTHEPAKKWLDHFQRALEAKKPDLEKLIAWECGILHGEKTLTFACKSLVPGLDLLPLLGGAVQEAGINWSDERNAEEQWRAAQRDNFAQIQARWKGRRRVPFSD